MSKSHRTAKSEPTIATRTLRSHPWHDVHSITHRQMAEKPGKGAQLQILSNGVRVQNEPIAPDLVKLHWGDTKCWMRKAIESIDPFQPKNQRTLRSV